MPPPLISTWTPFYSKIYKYDIYAYMLDISYQADNFAIIEIQNIIRLHEFRQLSIGALQSLIITFLEEIIRTNK
jgi:hypothetical protein